jgi:hypothetical protein
MMIWNGHGLSYRHWLGQGPAYYDLLLRIYLLPPLFPPPVLQQSGSYIALNSQGADFVSTLMFLRVALLISSRGTAS